MTPPPTGGFFTVHRGDGSFDYNCDTQITKKYAPAGCQLGGGTCVPNSANMYYVESTTPGCGGDPVTLAVCNASCQVQKTTVTSHQACR
jgi:hypothetical protein